MNWQAPPLPAGYPWPAPPHMAAMPPMGVRPPPVMFGPPPPGFPPGGFQQPPRLPFSAPQEKAGEESEKPGADGEIGKPEGSGGDGDNCPEESLHEEDEDVPGVPYAGNFPRPPMGCGDWNMRGPVPPFMRGPNIPRPDLLRGPRPLLGESPTRLRALLPAPPSRFSLPMPESYPDPAEEEDEEYYDEYGDEEENEEEEYEEEEYDEECEEFPSDGKDYFVCFSVASLVAGFCIEFSHSTKSVLV